MHNHPKITTLSWRQKIHAWARLKWVVNLLSHVKTAIGREQGSADSDCKEVWLLLGDNKVIVSMYHKLFTLCLPHADALWPP